MQWLYHSHSDSDYPAGKRQEFLPGVRWEYSTIRAVQHTAPFEYIFFLPQLDGSYGVKLIEFNSTKRKPDGIAGGASVRNGCETSKVSKVTRGVCPIR